MILVVLNAIPLGQNVNRSLSGNKVLTLRLDYLAHTAMMLVFACIWFLGKILNISWFGSREVLKYSALIVLAGIGLELLQLLLPWRVYNPMDLIFNLVGASLAATLVVVSHLSLRCKAGHKA